MFLTLDFSIDNGEDDPTKRQVIYIRLAETNEAWLVLLDWEMHFDGASYLDWGDNDCIPADDDGRAAWWCATVTSKLYDLLTVYGIQSRKEFMTTRGGWIRVREEDFHFEKWTAHDNTRKEPKAP